MTSSTPHIRSTTVPRAAVCTSINTARACLIVLMILVHITQWGDHYPQAKLGILSFMMPAFLFVTGMLLNVQKGLGDFLRYLRGILVPYVVLVSAFAVLSCFLPVRGGLTALTLAGVWERVAVTSIGPYWFLRNMFFCSVIWYAVYHLLKRRMDSAGRLFVYGAALLAFTLAWPFEMTTASAFYYYIGVVAREALGRYDRVVVGSPWALLLLGGIVVWPAAWDWMYISVPVMAYCALSFTAWADQRLAAACPSLHRSVQYVGMNTLPIYLLHPVFTMAAKFYAPLFGWDPTSLAFTLVTLAVATAGCLALALVLDRTRLSWLLGRPCLLRRLKVGSIN